MGAASRAASRLKGQHSSLTLLHRHRQDSAAVYCEIDAAALALFVERAGDEQSRVERAADGEHRVADGLGFQAVARAAPEEAVIAIQAQFGVVELRRLLVDGARHNE